MHISGCSKQPQLLLLVCNILGNEYVQLVQLLSEWIYDDLTVVKTHQMRSASKLPCPWVEHVTWARKVHASELTATSSSIKEVEWRNSCVEKY